jgi:hypothetical protein
MQSNIETFNYDGKAIEFEIITGKNLMVNATAMAKVFDKQINEFTSNDTTKSFILACLNNGNSRYLMIENLSDLIQSKQKSGTWMHLILALKFAAWLNPDFELWVYSTIDQLIFGHFAQIEESLKESAKRRNNIETLRNQLRETEVYRDLEKLELEEKQAVYQRGKVNRMQLSLFSEQTKEGDN